MPDPSPDTTPEVSDAPPTAPPADSAPEVESSEDGQVDLSTLPAPVQEHIRELREEAKNNRVVHDPFKKAFQHFNEAEQQYLLQMIDTMGVDEKAGAAAFVELGIRMGADVPQEAVDTLEDPEVQQAADDAGLTREELVETIRAEVEQDKLIAAAEQETRDLGFEPYTPEADMLWDLAIAMKEDDLSKVAPVARLALGKEPPAEEAPAEEAPKSGNEVQEDILGETDVPNFPATPTIPASTGDVNVENQVSIPKLGSDELRDRVMRRFEAANKPG